ncbi:MAG TPA: OsmC family protein [Fimbriimonadaceae bacterium]|nr:OsmC family protein [Fimbriimonadaceae bacterium]HRJ32388.1 OsmC family protein [Fimbriimonadaceae bacterium]
MVNVQWQGDMRFQATSVEGTSWMMDAYPEEGQVGAGPTPVQALVASVAGCMAMDVISILQKKQQKVTSYRIDLEWERGPEGVYPRPITQLTLRHVFAGEGLDPTAVHRAIQLSDEKYCTVMATLRVCPSFETVVEIQ